VRAVEQAIGAAKSVIVLIGAKAATQTIPVVFGMAYDPVESGLVASLNRPSGNLTGVTSVGTELAGKRLELLHKLVPLADPIAYYSRFGGERSKLQTAARVLGVRLLDLGGTTESKVAAAFATLVEQRAGALLIVACEGSMHAGLGRQIRSGGCDRLDARLLVVGDDRHRFARLLSRRGGYLLEDFHLAINAQNLGHLFGKVGIALFQVVSHFVRLDFFLVEDFAHRALRQMGKARMSLRRSVLAGMAGEKPVVHSS
jgi:hypothetical protein